MPTSFRLLNPVPIYENSQQHQTVPPIPDHIILCPPIPDHIILCTPIPDSVTLCPPIPGHVYPVPRHVWSYFTSASETKKYKIQHSVPNPPASIYTACNAAQNHRPLNPAVPSPPPHSARKREKRTQPFFDQWKKARKNFLNQ